MILRALKYRFRRTIRDESGAAMVEFAIVAGLFFLIMFATFDFGRMVYAFVHVEKAAGIATRIAVARPAICNNVPVSHLPPSGAGADHPRSGTSCDFQAGVCAVVNVSCNLDGTVGAIFPGDTSVTPALPPASITVNEIWSRIEGLMPAGTTADDITFRYQTDARLGYLGGPLTPVVTVEFDIPDFQFVSPIGGLIALASGQGTSTTWGTIAYPDFSVSLPAEDLKHGP